MTVCLSPRVHAGFGGTITHSSLEKNVGDGGNFGSLDLRAIIRLARQGTGQTTEQPLQT